MTVWDTESADLRDVRMNIYTTPRSDEETRQIRAMDSLLKIYAHDRSVNELTKQISVRLTPLMIGFLKEKCIELGIDATWTHFDAGALR